MRQTFIEEIKTKLNGLNKREKQEFACRCAVRSLPFLGIEGNFNFWRIEKRQKYLYSLFFAIDISLGDASGVTIFDASISVVASAALAASDATVYAAYAASKAVYAAVYTASSGHATTNSAAASASSASSASATVRNIQKYLTKDIKPIILEDLNLVRSGGKQKIAIEDYGELWQNFQKALVEEGCKYWADVYQDIFENNFKVNKEALRIRLSVPEKIRELGAKAVAEYLIDLEKGSQELNEARIIVLGDKGIGKTSIARKLVEINAPMPKKDESTVGVDILHWQLKDSKTNVHIWDFAGETVTHAVHQFFLAEKCLYIILYDSRTENKERLKFWLNQMKNKGGDSSAIILVNQFDNKKPDINKNNLKANYRIVDIYNFSIKNDRKSLVKFRKMLSKHLGENPSWFREDIPSNYFQVKEELEKYYFKCEDKKSREKITIDEFEKISEKFKVDYSKTLLERLHQLGIGLWYKEMEEFKTLILNPEWISDGVYKIINWVNNKGKSSIKITEFNKVFAKNTERYRQEDYQFLWSLMRYYELAYELEGQKLIIPHLLREDRPDQSVIPQFSVGYSLKIVYRATYELPADTISRFIVRHHREIKKEKRRQIVWRKGAILIDEKGSTALVIEEDRSISVSVKGRGKREYLTVIRATLNEIFRGYKSENPKLFCGVVEEYGELGKEICWIEDKKLLNYSTKGIPLYDDNGDKQVDKNRAMYNFNLNDKSVLNLGDNSVVNSVVINKHFSFKNCNINLRGSLNELAASFDILGERELGNELKATVKILKDTRDLKDKDEIKASGLLGKLQNITNDFANEKSKLHKNVKRIKRGIELAQGIGKGYNDIAQWCGLPQIPRPFLGKNG